MARPGFERKGSEAYWGADGWDPDDRVYVGASAGSTSHHLAVQPESGDHPQKASPTDVAGTAPKEAESPSGTVMQGAAGGLCRLDSTDFWDAMEPSMKQAGRTGNQVSHVASIPTPCTTVVSEEPQPDDAGDASSSDGGSFWDQAGWGDVPRVDHAPSGGSPSPNRVEEVELAPDKAKQQLRRVNSNQYWDAEQWDPDERVYVGADIGQTNHLTAVDLSAQDKANQILRIWEGGLSSVVLGFGDKAGPPIELTALPDGRPKLDDLYEISEETLGVGSFGVVRSATHRKTGARCAVKALGKMATGERYRRAHVDGRLGERLLRMTNEAPHENIARYLDMLEGPNHWYCVMEELQGQELLDQLEDQFPVTEAYLQRIVPQVLKSLAHIHGPAVSMVHRDIKLSNYRFRQNSLDSTLVLLDFGFACSVDADWDGAVCGTPMFMAPEVISRSAATPHLAAMDMWAAGIILYVLVTGDSPLQEKELKQFEKPETHKEASEHLAKALEARDLKLASAEVTDLLESLLVVNPASRITAAKALQHPWLTMTSELTLKVPSGKYRQMVQKSGSRASSNSARSFTRMPPGPPKKRSTPDLEAALESLGLERIVSTGADDDGYSENDEQTVDDEKRSEE